MLATGTLVKCERCGKELFFHDKERLGDSQYKFNTSDWKQVEGKIVCPECKAEYDARMDVFWNEIWDK